jgi:hypothetical protein
MLEAKQIFKQYYIEFTFSEYLIDLNESTGNVDATNYSKENNAPHTLLIKSEKRVITVMMPVLLLFLRG